MEPVEPPVRAEPFEATLVSARNLSRNVRELVFERSDGRPLRFSPGQWVNVHLATASDAEQEVKRAYSIASAPRADNRFELAITRVEGGPMSEALHRLDVGATVRAVGPSGLFTRAATDETPALFVATGTGITPLRSMIAAAADAGVLDRGTKMVVLFGVRTQADILYRDEFDRLAAQHPNVRFVVTLSKPDAAWTGRVGYVQTHVRELWDELAEPTANAYVCGLEKMVKSVRDVLRNEAGVGRRQVHQERYD
ncbi:MAG: FAD-dependent oxidoreductase [Polyangiaceae bacterium]